MGPTEWLTALGIALTVISFLLGIWMRAGKIIERVETLLEGHRALSSKVERHENRITKLEVRTAK